MNKKEKVFENDVAIIYYWPEIKLIENKWLKKIYFDSQLYRTPFIKALEIADKLPVRLYLSDIRNEGIVPSEEKRWFQNEIIPRAKEKGIEYGAVVTDINAFQEYYMNSLIKAGKKVGLPIKTYTDYNKAITWLKSKINPKNQML